LRDFSAGNSVALPKSDNWLHSKAAMAEGVVSDPVVRAGYVMASGAEASGDFALTAE
jgi:hypothetical protein